ncbi:MAG TPA: Hsp70 family protein [Acetobacteraceae bacterium]
MAVSPRGRPVRADSAVGIGGSCAGAKDFARPGRWLHSELPASRLEQQLRPVWLCIDDQEITITVPALFDAPAQRLTLNAAEAAGFPGSVRLLEEPQAAFYCWLERHSSANPNPLWEGRDAYNAEPRHVLVVHIGGGTSDLSLFELRPGPSGGIPDITRVAVSEHILLGGDNIDLALAALLEPRLVGERGHRPAVGTSGLLMSRSERAGPFGHRFGESAVGGSGLVAGVQTASLARGEVERLVLDEFLPACHAHV